MIRRAGMPVRGDGNNEAAWVEDSMYHALRPMLAVEWDGETCG